MHYHEPIIEIYEEEVLACAAEGAIGTTNCHCTMGGSKVTHVN